MNPTPNTLEAAIVRLTDASKLVWWTEAGVPTAHWSINPNLFGEGFTVAVYATNDHADAGSPHLRVIRRDGIATTCYIELTGPDLLETIGAVRDQVEDLAARMGNLVQVAS